MAAHQRLDMRQGQSLVMTPQLQQAIKLLQLSNMELAELPKRLNATPCLRAPKTVVRASLKALPANPKPAKNCRWMPAAA